MKAYLPLVLMLLRLAPPLPAAEPAMPGTLLLDETFAAPALPKNWAPGGRPGSFRIEAGALQGTAQPDDAHGPSIGVPIEAQDLAVSFKVKLSQPGYFLFLVDGESQYGGAAHLLRVALSETQMYLAQDRGSLASKEEQRVQKEAATKAGQAVPPPTAEQLADPKYYRTERLGVQAGQFADEQWHQIAVQVRGNDFTVQVDAQPPVSGKGTVLAVKKSRLVFLVAHAGTVLLDEVKAWALPAPPL